MSQTRRSFVGALLATMATAVSGFRGGDRGAHDSKATAERFEVSPIAQLRDRFPKTVAYLEERGWEIERVPDHSLYMAYTTVSSNPGPVGVASILEGGYEARPSEITLTEVTFTFDVWRAGKWLREYTTDEALLNEVKYKRRKVLEEIGVTA